MSASPSPAPAIPSADLLALAERAARAAGELIVSRRPRQPEVADTKSSPTDVVTEMDRAAEGVLRRLLAEHRPQDAVLGEEDGSTAGSSGLTWVVDPIDGTVNYLYDLPAYAVSVAVVEGDPRQAGEWDPVAGCVHNPVTGQTWTAVRGGGAYEDGRRLRLAEPPAPSGALVATGFGYRAERRAGQARVLASLLPRIRDIRRFGCASLDLCLLARGSVDAYYERGLQPWDMAAGMLVARESGAVVRGLDRPAGEELLVAAAEPLAGQLAALLAEYGADRDLPAGDGVGPG